MKDSTRALINGLRWARANGNYPTLAARLHFLRHLGRYRKAYTTIFTGKNMAFYLHWPYPKPELARCNECGQVICVLRRTTECPHPPKPEWSTVYRLR